MTHEEIKATWREASRRLYAPTPEEYEKMFRERKETALEKLTAQYKRFSIMGCVMMIVSFCYFLFPTNLIVPHMQIWLVIAFMLYFATCSCMDYWLYKGVGGINCYTMTVKDVVEKAMYYKKKHHLFIAILLPMAVGIIGLLMYTFQFEKALVIGVLAGAIIGGAIGYRKYLDFMAEYKNLAD